MSNSPPPDLLNDLSLPLILHIEDEDGDARMVVRCLATAQCRARIARAGDGREAITILDAIADGSYERPDLILLDLRLPYASGFEVLQRAREHVQLADLPIVVFTSSEEQEDKDKCSELGCTEYIVKPMDYAPFRFALGEVCDRYVGEKVTVTVA